MEYKVVNVCDIPHQDTIKPEPYSGDKNIHLVNYISYQNELIKILNSRLENVNARVRDHKNMKQ